MKEDRLVGRFLEMVVISSESGEEGAFITWLKDRLERELGAECTLDGYGNLIAKLPGKNTNKKNPVLFGVHADTVRPGKGIEPVVQYGVIRSRGDTVLGADDKAGIAELMETLACVPRHPPLEIVVTREEELGLRGARNLDTSIITAKTGFLLDMDALDAVVIGGPSRMSIDIELKGRSAHAGMEPQKGISAIRAAAAAINSIHEGWVDNETTVNVGIISGGENRNAVPARAMLKAECRSLDHSKCLAQSRQIQEAFEAAAHRMGVIPEVRMDLAYRAIRIPDDAEVVRIAASAVSSAGLTPKVQLICGGTDASVYNEKGIQTVVMGTGARSEHSTEEHILIEDMVRAVHILTHVFEQLGRAVET